MTLKELMELIETPKDKINYLVLQSRGEVVLQTKEDNTVISVYKSGHIIYQNGGHTTAFPITDCKEYKYRTCDGSIVIIPSEDFMCEDWKIRVTLEGESRLERNQERDENDISIAASVGDVSETAQYLEIAGEEVFIDQTPSWEEKIIQQEELEILRSLIQELFPRQREVIKKHYFENKSYEEIARELGRSVKAVRHIEYRARERLKKRIKKTIY